LSSIFGSTMMLARETIAIRIIGEPNILSGLKPSRTMKYSFFPIARTSNAPRRSPVLSHALPRNVWLTEMDDGWVETSTRYGAKWCVDEIVSKR